MVALIIGVLAIVLLFFDRKFVSSRLICVAAVSLWIVAGFSRIDYLLSPAFRFEMLSVRFDLRCWLDFGFLMLSIPRPARNRSASRLMEWKSSQSRLRAVVVLYWFYAAAVNSKKTTTGTTRSRCFTY
jgi:hypothetical protein